MVYVESRSKESLGRLEAQAEEIKVSHRFLLEMTARDAGVSELDVRRDLIRRILGQAPLGFAVTRMNNPEQYWADLDILLEFVLNRERIEQVLEGEKEDEKSPLLSEVVVAESAQLVHIV